MKIENFRTERAGDRARVSATVTWEDCDRGVDEFWFETEEQFATDLICNPHAFLIGCAVPAIHYGEERVSIDAEICPQLRQGLITALSVLKHWYYDPAYPLLRIEARSQSTPATPAPRAGFFFSGGIDSLATLRTNHLDYPADHPGFIKDGLLVHGLEVDDPVAFGHVKKALTDLASRVGINLIPVFTNIYLPYRQEDARNHFRFWINEFMGAGLASVAHAFARRFGTVSISAGLSIETLCPGGSHPLIDENLSASGLRIHYAGFELSRLEKTALLAEWGEDILNHIRVCNLFDSYTSQDLNCGRCEKCMRTKLALAALDRLQDCTAFADAEITSEHVRQAVRIKNTYSELCYLELLHPLKALGRHDLTRAIERKLYDFHHPQWVAWKSRTRQIKQKLFAPRTNLYQPKTDPK